MDDSATYKVKKDDIARMPGLFLQGPYNKSYPQLDASYKKLKKEEFKEHMEMHEQPKVLQEVLDAPTSVPKNEYAELRNIEVAKRGQALSQESRVYTERQLESFDGKQNAPIDANFIKTPFHEENPVRETNSKGKPVNAPFGLIIASDGRGMQKGLGDFWDIVVEQNVTIVLSFNNVIKAEVMDEATECFRYFPGDTEDDCTLNIDEVYTVKHVVAKMIKTTSSTTRFLEVYEPDSSVPLVEMKHIHYDAWEDFKVPTNDHLADLIDILDECAVMLRDQVMQMHFNGLREPKRLLVHCMAGKGRTGTAVAIVNALICMRHQIELYAVSNANEPAAQRTDALKTNVQLSIYSLARRLREQRPKCIQTQQQYQFVYAFVADWFAQKIEAKQEAVEPSAEAGQI